MTDAIDDAAFRRNYTWIMRRLGKPGTQKMVAQALGMAESSMSEWKNSGSLERAIRILTALGGKVVDEGATCLDDIDAQFVHRIIARNATSGGLFGGDFEDTRPSGFADSLKGGL